MSTCYSTKWWNLFTYIRIDFTENLFHVIPPLVHINVPNCPYLSVHPKHIQLLAEELAQKHMKALMLWLFHDLPIQNGECPRIYDDWPLYNGHSSLIFLDFPLMTPEPGNWESQSSHGPGPVISKGMALFGADGFGFEKLLSLAISGDLWLNCWRFFIFFSKI